MYVLAVPRLETSLVPKYYEDAALYSQPSTRSIMYTNEALTTKSLRVHVVIVQEAFMTVYTTPSTSTLEREYDT